ncbi:hypothetical protein GW17_00043973 [Ensete ventricosum]|nr:hypothetical protein GW17_00043973 [Ensete ventricosum]
MESLCRKRKGTKSSSFVESNLIDGRKSKKKCREMEKVGSRNGGGGGVVMTAPPIGCSLPGTPGRGLKRKLGCIESATRIGRKKKLEHEYVLGREIGQGKFGSVRLCRSKASGEEFACKTLPKNGGETVHREVEIMQHLSGHPGIVMLKSVFEDSDCFHLVLELCSGGRLLDQMVKEGKFPEQRVAMMLKELVLVIKYCHEMGVVHRDIKPENILLTESGKIKLADFGLAVRCGPTGMRREPWVALVRAVHCRLSGVAGSAAYVAPELQDDSSFVDALAVAISRVTISESKPSRFCSPAPPIEPECSSNMKANLCTAF